MQLKPKYLVILIILFMVVVFLDQNRRPVPLKFILGTPFPVDLSLIILISMALGAVMTGGFLYYRNKRKKLKS